MEEFAKNIDKWVMWCNNYPDPETFISYISKNGGCNQNHLMDKFAEMYDCYGKNGVMNAFYCSLDTKNKKLLIDYVYNNYEE